MVDKYTTIPMRNYEDVAVIIANLKIPTYFFILKMHEDDNVSIILGEHS